MKLVAIKSSTRKGKRLMAVFDENGKEKVVHFGFDGGKTYLDHGDTVKKANYIARHSVNEDWTNPMTAGALSRYILWNKPTLSASIADFTKRFRL